MSYSPVKLHGNFGFGTMSLTWTPQPKPRQQSLDSIKYVIENHNVSFLNWGEFYGHNGSPLNLELLKDFLEKNDSAENRKLVFSIKGAVDTKALVPDGSKESIDRSINNILSYFPKDKAKRPQILFEIARRDFKTPYEETVGYIAEFVKAGKIDGISLSEVGTESISKAISVFPISAVELELSLLCQDLIFNGVLEELSKRQIPIIAYSPLCRGLLTDHAAETADTFLDSIPEGDIRHHMDKFSPENYKHNIEIVKKLYDFAHSKGTSLESLALSWILKISQLPEFEGIKNVTKILPIPSGSTKEKIDKNFGNLVELTNDDLAEIQKITTDNKVKGYRYQKHIDFMNFA